MSNITVEEIKLISEFDGFKNVRIESGIVWAKEDDTEKVTHGYFIVDYNSWDSIMQVVDKIENLKHNEFSYDVLIGFNNYCAVVQSKGRIGNTMKWESSKPYKKDIGNGNVEMGTWKPETKLKSVQQAVVQFIKFFNTQTP